MRTLFVLFCAFTSILHAEAKLDDYMPVDIQKYSGVYSLSDDQKQYLADWLAEHMGDGKKTRNEHHAKELFLSENVEGGKFLRLSDNSLWEVDPIDLSRSKIWLFPFPVRLRKNGRQDFPYTVTNMNTGSKVDVRRVGSQ